MRFPCIRGAAPASVGALFCTLEPPNGGYLSYTEPVSLLGARLRAVLLVRCRRSSGGSPEGLPGAAPHEAELALSQFSRKSAGLSRRNLLGLGLGAGALWACPALADLRIEITGVGANQMPIAVKPFQGTSGAPEDLAAVVCADLERSGAFRVIRMAGESADEDFNNPASLVEAGRLGANVHVVGVVRPVGDRWDVRCYLFDTVSGSLTDSFGTVVDTARLRMAAHRAADMIYTRLTGEGAMFASQLAYVVKHDRRSFELVVSDSDGANPRTALASPEPIISPVWSPDARSLAYVSFENKKPIVCLQELATGERRAVAAFPGNNSAPAFSPDGRELAVALSRDGLTQIYLINRDGSRLRRFTRSYGIDTEPTFSADGRWIYFTSDRGGTPQIYRQPVAGGSVERVTFGSNYAISPSVSPDGTRLAYVSRIENRFRVAVMDLATGQDLLVTNTERDESPSFAPNGRFLVYATEENGRGVLGVCSADARLATRLSGEGDIREPAWGPVLP